VSRSPFSDGGAIGDEDAASGDTFVRGECCSLAEDSVGCGDLISTGARERPAARGGERDGGAAVFCRRQSCEARVIVSGLTSQHVVVLKSGLDMGLGPGRIGSR
jgi:hypothetical protein